MRKRFIKIGSVFFLVGILTSLLGACSDGDNVKDLFNKGSSKNPFANVGDNNGANDSKGGNNAGNSNNNTGNSNNGSNSDIYTMDALSFSFYSGNDECGVYADLSVIRSKGITDIYVPPTYSIGGNTYNVKYDCNNGFNALEGVETVSFSDGFEKVAVGFGSSMQLEKVLLPASLKKITCRMLVNCLAFKAIEFKGTRAQWEAVEKEESWNDMAPEFTVKCSDGNITVPVYVDE